MLTGYEAENKWDRLLEDDERNQIIQDEKDTTDLYAGDE